MGNPSESSEQVLTFEEEALSEEDTGRSIKSKDSIYISTALDSKMAEDSFYKKIAAIRESQHEYTS